MRTASEIKNISFKHAILAQLDVRNVTLQSAAVRIGIAPRTFYMRLSDPGSFIRTTSSSPATGGHTRSGAA